MGISIDTDPELEDFAGLAEPASFPLAQQPAQQKPWVPFVIALAGIGSVVVAAAIIYYWR